MLGWHNSPLFPQTYTLNAVCHFLHLLNFMSVLFMLCLQSIDYSFTKDLQNKMLEPHYVILATKTTLKKSVHDHYRMN